MLLFFFSFFFFLFFFPFYLLIKYFLYVFNNNEQTIRMLMCTFKYIQINLYILKDKKQTLHKLMYVFSSINKHNMILAITRINNEITITINIYTFINLSIKLIFYFLKCKDFSYIICINRHEYVRELSIYKSCKA